MTVMARSILVPLVGLPGVGKTTFVTKVMRYLSESNLSESNSQLNFSNVNVVHFHYDKFLPHIRSENDVRSTKCFRKAAVAVVDGFLNAIADIGNSAPGSVCDILRGVQSDVGRASSSEIAEAARDIISTLTLNHSITDPLLSSRSSSLIIIFLDDNNLYRSMRYEFYQLARKFSVSFLQLFFDSSPTTASARDASRDSSVRVGDRVIGKVAEKLERPDPSAYRWERRFCRILVAESGEKIGEDIGAGALKRLPDKGDNSFAEDDLTLAVDRILTAARERVQSAPIEEKVSQEQREEDRRTCLKSVLHQCDVKLRMLVGRKIKEMRTLNSAFDAKTAAAKLAMIKSVILDKAKKGDLQLDLEGLHSELEIIFDEEIYSQTDLAVSKDIYD